MKKYFVSKNGYFYKTINNKNIRISKEEYVKNNKSIKGGAPKVKPINRNNNYNFELQNMSKQNMSKNKITVIFVGASETKKNNGSRDNKTGQIPDLREFIGINQDNTVISVDSFHANNEHEHLKSRSKIDVSIMANPNDIKQKCLNVSYSESNDFFNHFRPDPRTYYVILVFCGSQKELPSFNVAQSIGIENPFFYDIKNAFCLGMECFNIPPNITNLLTTIGFRLKPVFVPEIDQTLQIDFYAISSELRALYKATKRENGVSRTPERITEILNSLKKININTIEEACDYYEHLKRTYGSLPNGRQKDVDEGMLKKLIEEKYRNLLPFFTIRNS